MKKIEVIALPKSLRYFLITLSYVLMASIFSFMVVTSFSDIGCALMLIPAGMELWLGLFTCNKGRNMYVS